MTTQEKAEDSINGVGDRFVGDQLLTKQELAPRLKRSHRTISAWMRQGKLPYLKVGKSVLFKWGDVVEKLSAYRVN